MKTRIAALLGDYYHKADIMQAALTAAAEGYELEAFTQPEALPWEGLGQYTCLIIAREGRLDPAKPEVVWFTDRHMKVISDFVTAGGGLVVVHAGLASYGFEGTYGSLVRGSFQFHPNEHPRFSLRATGARHPMMAEEAPAGSALMELQDEMYFVRIDSGRTTPLLEAFSPDYGSSTAAWAHQAGRGRVFCFTPGHRVEVLEDPAWRRFAAAGIRWAAGGK